MSAPMKADSESGRLSSLSEPEEDIPIDLLDEAELNFGKGLPPFIQKNLDPIIMPGDKHQVIPKTNNGTIPSIKSTKRVQLVCRAWNNSNSDRFWTYDYRNVRYIVKAFRTHAQPQHMPKIAYHVWEGMGGQSRFQHTQIAFDADDRLYGPDTKEKFIPSGFGTIDTNKELRRYPDYLDYMLDRPKRSSTTGKGKLEIRFKIYIYPTYVRLLTDRLGASNLRMKAFSEHDIASEDDDQKWIRRTRSMTQKKTTYGRPNHPPASSRPSIPLINTDGESESKSTELDKSRGHIKAQGINGSKVIHEDNSDEIYKNKFSGLRARRTERQVIIKRESSNGSNSNYHPGPKKTSKNREEHSSDAKSTHHNKHKKLSQDQGNEKTDGISDHNSIFHTKSSKSKTSHDKPKTDHTNEGKSIRNIKSTKLVTRQVKPQAEDIREGNCSSQEKPTMK